MLKYDDKTALITGASSGIGRGFAEKLAQKGTNLVLVSRDEKKLNILADKLKTDYDVRVLAMSLDLTKNSSIETIRDFLKKKNISIDILVNNAGFGSYGHFHENSPESNYNQIMLNVTALTRLTQILLPPMLNKKEGIIVNLASTAAFQPNPYMAVYGATKAFVLSFSEALWAEYHSKGIRILALCPGPTNTNFFDKFSKNAFLDKRRTVDQVIKTALKALEKNKSYAIDGFKNYILANATRLLTRKNTANIMKRAMQPKK